MVTSKDIVDKTRLSTKTLTRWWQRGIIPKPAVRTHPNGRGKIAYWPDWVLDRCVRIVELRKQGHDLKTAVMMLGAERVEKLVEKVRKNESFSQILAGKEVRLADGKTVSLIEVFQALIMQAVEQSVVDRDLHSLIATQLREDRLAALAIDMIQNGYNMLLTFDGTKTRVEPDFLLGHLYEQTGPTARSFVAVPLLGPFRRLLEALGGLHLIRDPAVTPAPKVWVKEGDVMVEYVIYLGGRLGFELVRETATTIAAVRSEDGPVAPDCPEQREGDD